MKWPAAVLLKALKNLIINDFIKDFISSTQIVMAENPPSTVISDPVTNDDASDAR